MSYRKIIITVFVLIASGTYFLPAFPAGRKSRFTPPEGKIIFMVGQDKTTIDEYVASTGITPAGVMSYTSLKNLEGLDEPAEYGSGAQDARYLLARYPQSVLQLGLYCVGIMEQVPLGVYDEQLTRLASWLIKARRPVFLRIGYEFDGPHNGYAPAAYIAAYRYMVDFLRARGVDTVSYVWHSYAGPSRDPGLWYPGDEYVDWIALSYFDPAYEPCRQKVVAIAREHRKPLMIAEATPRGMGVKRSERAWQRWFIPFFDFIRTANVGAVCYINSDWEKLSMFAGQGWGNARVQDDAFIFTHWTESVSHAIFMKASGELFGLLGYHS